MKLSMKRSAHKDIVDEATALLKPKEGEDEVDYRLIKLDTTIGSPGHCATVASVGLSMRSTPSTRRLKVSILLQSLLKFTVLTNFSVL
jgi:hypothetical protein